MEDKEDIDYVFRGHGRVRYTLCEEQGWDRLYLVRTMLLWKQKQNGTCCPTKVEGVACHRMRLVKELRKSLE